MAANHEGLEDDEAQLLALGEGETVEIQAPTADEARRLHLAGELLALAQEFRASHPQLSTSQRDRLATAETLLTTSVDVKLALSHDELQELELTTHGLIKEVAERNADGAGTSASANLLSSPARSSRLGRGSEDDSTGNESDDGSAVDELEQLVEAPEASTDLGRAYYAAVHQERDQAVAELSAVTTKADKGAKVKKGEKKLKGKNASRPIPRFPFGEVKDAVEKELLFSAATEMRACPCGHVVFGRADFFRHFLGCQLGVRYPCPVYGCAWLAARPAEMEQHVKAKHTSYSVETDNPLTKKD